MQLDAKTLVNAYREEVSTLQQRVIELTAYTQMLQSENSELRSRLNGAAVGDSDNGQKEVTDAHRNSLAGAAGPAGK